MVVSTTFTTFEVLGGGFPLPCLWLPFLEALPPSALPELRFLLVFLFDILTYEMIMIS